MQGVPGQQTGTGDESALTVQGVPGQQTGTGDESASTGAAPEASSKNVTRIIRTIVFFIFQLLLGMGEKSRKKDSSFLAWRAVLERVGVFQGGLDG